MKSTIDTTIKPITDITSIESYVSQFSNGLAAKVSAQSVPLHDPSKQPDHPRINTFVTPLLEKQRHAVTGVAKALTANGLAILACNMGTGKTPQAISVAHCHADGRNYRALVICPPHLVTKWRDEVHKFLGGGVQASIIENWQQYLDLRYAPDPKTPVWYIMAMTVAKLGYSKRVATKKKIASIYLEGSTTPIKIEAHTCTKCGYIARNRKKLPASTDDIENGWLKCVGKWCKKCGVSHNHDLEECPNTLLRDGERQACGHPLRPCGEPLWQACTHKISPAQYVRSRGCNLFDYFIRDEAHESKGSDSMDGHAATIFAKHADYTLLLTGTLLAGKSEDLRPLLFRLKPRAFIEKGFGWGDEIPFAKRYGRIQTVTKESSGGTKRKSGTGSSKSTTQSVKPGIMPHLYPDFVANYTVFMSLPELATELPSYVEETRRIPMDASMAAEYEQMKNTCLNSFRSLYMSNRRAAMKMLGSMLEAFMTWPDVPYDRKPVGYSTDDGQYITIYRPADLDPSNTFAKEKALIEYLREEKLRKRKCWIFSVRDDTSARLRLILEANGFKVAMLKTTVKPATRIQWLKENGPSADVGLCHPELVQTGLELFGPGFNFPTLLWYSTGFKLNVLRQASRRSWRIGQKEDCKTVYFYYDESAQKTAVGVMAAKLVAAEAIEGRFSDGGLADESVDQDVALQVARSLADNIKVEVASRYKPIQSATTEADRVKMLRNRMAAFKARFKVTA